jgi:hypothetical protein
MKLALKTFNKQELELLEYGTKRLLEIEGLKYLAQQRKPP